MNSQKIIFAICALFVFPFAMLSQNFSVSGRVINESNKAISYANIIVLKANDSTTVSGTTSNELGKFTINNLSQDSYLIEISFIWIQEVFQSN